MGCCFGCLKGQSEEKENGNQSLHAAMLRERDNANVLDKYEVIQRLGEGSMGSVSLVRVKDSAKGGSAFKTKERGPLGFTKVKKRGSMKERRAVEVDYALKTIILSRVSSEFVEELKNEIMLLRQMDHMNIVKAYEVFSRNWEISIIMELCSGGDLHARKPYSEKDANSITKQLTSAIKYMHSRSIVHRDCKWTTILSLFDRTSVFSLGTFLFLVSVIPCCTSGTHIAFSAVKFENIMWESATSDQIKVIDFGLSKYSKPGEKYMYEGVGTVRCRGVDLVLPVECSSVRLEAIVGSSCP